MDGHDYAVESEDRKPVRKTGMPTMKEVVVGARTILLAILVLTGACYWIARGYSALGTYDHAVPPSSIQTFHDFLKWQSEIGYCLEVEVRGVTYFHVVGPIARTVASGGALYVFDANGNYVGWSRDCGDVMRNEAVFYPGFWLPRASSGKKLSLEELKERIPSENRDKYPRGGKRWQ